MTLYCCHSPYRSIHNRIAETCYVLHNVEIDRGYALLLQRLGQNSLVARLVTSLILF